MQKRNISIRIKLICIVIPIVLVMIISMFVLAGNMITKTTKDTLQAKALGYTEQINVWTNQILGELQIYQDAIESGQFSNDDAILDYMEISVDNSEAYPVGLYMGDDSGVYLDASGWIPGDDWVLTERDWYIEGKDNEKLAFGEPYYDSMTGQVCVSVSVLVDYSKATRVLATDVYLDYVSGLVTGIYDNSDMEAFLVTKESQTVIAHFDSNMMAVTLDSEGLDSLYGGISKALNEGKTGVVSIDGNDGEYYVSINSVNNADWYLVTYVKQNTVLADLHKMQFIMLIIALFAAVILILVILRMMNGIVKPVEQMTDVIDKIAEGDFSQNLVATGNDEIARMSNNMQEFISKMRGTIADISNIAGGLKIQSLQNNEVSDSLKEYSQIQANEMNMLEQMVERLSVAANEVSAQMDGLTALAEKASTESEVANVLMEESVILSQDGKQNIEQINDSMNNINDSISTLAEHIDNVSNIILQIGNMVGMIVDIAEETNLLSLNASIEAARAGEAGRGFVVVAEQIAKLAANSSQVTDDISQLTEEIQKTVDVAVEHMVSSMTEVNINIRTVSEASAIFDALYEKLDDTNNRVKQMIELAGEVDMVSKQMDDIIDNQLQATKQIAQSAEALSQQTVNVTEGSSTVAENASQLQKESTELMNRISYFKM